MQEVHTESRRTVPSTTALTRWMFGFQRRRVRRWEWLMRMPKDGCLPHTSQTEAIAPNGTRRGGTPQLRSPVMDALSRLGPDDLRAAVAAYRDVLSRHRDELN